MDNQTNVTSQSTDINPKPFSVVLVAQMFALIVSFILISIREYGGFNYFGDVRLIIDVIARALGAVFVFPLLHIAIASIWKSKRGKATRWNIFFGWAITVCVIQILTLVNLSS